MFFSKIFSQGCEGQDRMGGLGEVMNPKFSGTSSPGQFPIKDYGSPEKPTLALGLDYL
jgi:hypothetical protein